MHQVLRAQYEKGTGIYVRLAGTPKNSAEWLFISGKKLAKLEGKLSPSLVGIFYFNLTLPSPAMFVQHSQRAFPTWAQ